MRRRAEGRRRGFVLIAVVVVIAAAVLVATGAIFTARAATAGLRASVEQNRLRDAALDGVRIAAERLAASRAEVLAGAAPDLDPSILVLGEGVSRLEVVLSPMPGGGYAESESAKIPLDALDRTQLESLVAARAEMPSEFIDALEGARADEGIDACVGRMPADIRPEALGVVLGPLSTLETEESPLADDTSPAPLATVITVHAQEALVGIDGTPRLDLVAIFEDGEDGSDASASLADFDDGELAAMRSAAGEAGERPDDGALAAALLGRGVAIERIGEILDRCTLLPGRLAPARLDVGRASAEVLAALEVGGQLVFGAEGAERVVDLRESLDDSERRGTAWLVSRRVLEADAFARAAGHLSPRSTAWRFRVVARPAPDVDDAEPITPTGARAAFDVVVDIGGESPRIVFLRDVSMLGTARVLARAEAARALLQDDPIRFADALPEVEADTTLDATAVRPSFLPPTGLAIPPRPATLPIEPPARPIRRSTSERGRDVAD